MKWGRIAFSVVLLAAVDCSSDRPPITTTGFFSVADGVPAPVTTGPSPGCGDGKINFPGEECDDGVFNGTSGDCCSVNCKALLACLVADTSSASSGTGTSTMNSATSTGTSASSGGGCPPLVAKVVTSMTDPTMPGPGLPSVWQYKSLVGAAAGKALCLDAGADHVCSYLELLKADVQGELVSIPNNLTYWLQRTSNVPSALQPAKACATDGDCQTSNDPGAVCDPVNKTCAWKPGALARCNDWTYPDDAIAAGEFFAVVGHDPNPSGGVIKGTLSYHFLKSTSFDTPIVCQDPNAVGCAGGCMSGGLRAIVCCHACP